jgi:16S rRNA (cytidine1402-2'-O)-methyltransferase
MLSYYEHNKLTRIERILEALTQGDVALVSEAGTPLLSDPGYELVRAAIQHNFSVTPIPGPSALTAALSVSGLPTDRVLFIGFLPRKPGERRQVLQELTTQTATIVCYESPHRWRSTLADMVELLGSSRAVVVCRELTKLHEETWRGTLAEAQAEWGQREPRGEFTLVIAGDSGNSAWEKSEVETALLGQLAGGNSLKTAVQQITGQSGWSKREVYALAQKLKEQGD